MILNQMYSPIQRIELVLQRNFSDLELFQKLENTYYYTPPQHLSFSNFITDDFASKMAEQTNL